MFVKQTIRLRESLARQLCNFTRARALRADAQSNSELHLHANSVFVVWSCGLWWSCGLACLLPRARLLKLVAKCTMVNGDEMNDGEPRHHTSYIFEL